MTGTETVGLPEPRWRRTSFVPILVGAVGSLALLGLDLGVIALAQGWAHAWEQLGADRWFVVSLALGFGTQVALISVLGARHARAHTGGVAVSAGTGAAGMLACCAHHLADILPILGISGAAIFLNAYRTPLLWLGIAMNLSGVVYLARLVARRPRRASTAVGSSWVTAR